MERKEREPEDVDEGRAAAAIGPVELSDEQLDTISGGSGKVSLQDFHFVQKVTKSSP